MRAAPPAGCLRPGGTLRVLAPRLRPSGTVWLGLAALLALWLTPRAAQAAATADCSCPEPVEQSVLIEGWAGADAPPCSLEPLCTMQEQGPSRRTDQGRRIYAVPICLPEGASGIAPLPALSIEDHRIEGLPSCGDDAPGAQHLRPTDRDESSPEPPAVHDAGLAADGEAPLRPRPPPAVIHLSLDPGDFAPGIAQRVYRPPRT